MGIQTVLYVFKEKSNNTVFTVKQQMSKRSASQWGPVHSFLSAARDLKGPEKH